MCFSYFVPFPSPFSDLKFLGCPSVLNNDPSHTKHPKETMRDVGDSTILMKAH